MIIINPIHGILKHGNESGVIMMPNYAAIFSQKKKMDISNFSHKQTAATDNMREVTHYVQQILNKLTSISHQKSWTLEIN